MARPTINDFQTEKYSQLFIQSLFISHTEQPYSKVKTGYTAHNYKIKDADSKKEEKDYAGNQKWHYVYISLSFYYALHAQ